MAMCCGDWSRRRVVGRPPSRTMMPGVAVGPGEPGGAGRTPARDRATAGQHTLQSWNCSACPKHCPTRPQPKSKLSLNDAPRVQAKDRSE